MNKQQNWYISNISWGPIQGWEVLKIYEDINERAWFILWRRTIIGPLSWFEVKYGSAKLIECINSKITWEFKKKKLASWIINIWNEGTLHTIYEVRKE